MIQRLTLRPGERRGYWRFYSQKTHRQTIVKAQVDDYNARVLLDSGAEVSILDSDFARKIGADVDTSKSLNCEGVGGSGFPTDGRAKIKVVLAGELAYECEVWVGRLGNLDAILGTDFMTPAGIRLDLAEGVALMPDEVRVQFEGRRSVYSDKAEQVRIKRETTIYPGESTYIRLRPIPSKRLWLKRDERWVSTAECNEEGQPTRVKVSNIFSKPVTIATQVIVGMWLPPSAAPRQSGFVSLNSRRYNEWCTLVYESEPEPVLEARREAEADAIRRAQPPPTDRVKYPMPRAILQRSPRAGAAVAVAKLCSVKGDSKSEASVNSEKGVGERASGHVAPTSGNLEHSNEVTTKVCNADMGSCPMTIADWAKVAMLFVVSKSAAEATPDQAGLGETVFAHEGGDVSAEELESQMAMIPELPAADGEITPADIKIAPGEDVSTEEIERVREMVWRRRAYLMGNGNARPLPAKGVVCDIDVGDAKPIAQTCRKVPPQFVDKLYELLKGLLQAGFIAPSTSPWASPIVIVIKKNGVDIRLCIDYRMVNALTRLMVYPMPVVHDLLENLGTLRWLCSLDMASGFWVVRMTARARAISAFVTPFGLFEWTRMPFGLRNAPQIYQRLLDNALYGYLKLTPKHLQEDEADVFVDGKPAGAEAKPAIGRRSYIDDILFGGETWDEMCERLERLLDACEEWGLSISLPKSEFGMSRVDYLGHTVSAEGIKAKPKNLDELVRLPFPRTVKGLQSFLGSLNYYHQFVEHFAVYAAALYEVTQADLARETLEPGHLATARRSFAELQRRLADAPVLRHFDGEKTAVLVIYANPWAIAATLAQEYDGKLLPVKFFSRVLKDHEIKFSPAEKEILALLHALGAAANTLAGRPIKVLTRHSSLGWLFRARGLQGRLERWMVTLSPWTLEVIRVNKGEDELTGLLAAAVGPAEHTDTMLELIHPRKRATSERFSLPVPTLAPDAEAWVVSFDGSAKPKRTAASCGAVLWRAPTWEVVAAETHFFTDGTVNEAEYRGAMAAMDLAIRHGVRDVIICGDSRIVIQQLRGDIECRTVGLQVLHAEALLKLSQFRTAHLVHVSREYNAAADLITGKALQRGAGATVDDAEYGGMKLLNRLHEVLVGDPREDDDLRHVGDAGGVDDTRSQSGVRDGAGVEPCTSESELVAETGADSDNVVREQAPPPTDGDEPEMQSGGQEETGHDDMRLPQADGGGAADDAGDDAAIAPTLNAVVSWTNRCERADVGTGVGFETEIEADVPVQPINARYSGDRAVDAAGETTSRCGSGYSGLELLSRACEALKGVDGASSRCVQVVTRSGAGTQPPTRVARRRGDRGRRGTEVAGGGDSVMRPSGVSNGAVDAPQPTDGSPDMAAFAGDGPAAPRGHVPGVASDEALLRRGDAPGPTTDAPEMATPVTLPAVTGDPSSDAPDMGTGDESTGDCANDGPVSGAVEDSPADHASDDDVRVDGPDRLVEEQTHVDGPSHPPKPEVNVHRSQLDRLPGDYATREESHEDQHSADTATRSEEEENVEYLIARTRAHRIKVAQDEESWVARLKCYLRGDVKALTTAQVTACAKLAAAYELVDGLLYYVGAQRTKDRERDEVKLRLVVPTTLHREILHHYHVSLAGGHQGVSRVYERVRRLLFWRNMYADVRDYVAACSDCQSGKGQPRIGVKSPGNIVATRPFEILGMDHVPSLPKSHRGNTELLVWVDHHTGFVIVSANKSREAQEVAESYERCVYRRFGASTVIRHDREPAFMSAVFRAFNRLIGQRSRATLAYRPQANGMTERMVQTVMHAVKLYVADHQQRDWDDYAERLVFALNLAYDRTRGDSAFYLLHGWEPKTTLEVALPTADRREGHADARRWRSQVQVQYQKARQDVSRLLQEAMESRREASQADVHGDSSAIVTGAKVWLFINQVKPGFARKLAHFWHGPFRVLERPADHLVKLEIDGSAYRVFPVVHVSRLKLWREFEPRPVESLEVAVDQRFDFDEAMLPEDSLEPDNEQGEYEVAAIIGHRDTRPSRLGRPIREYQVLWVGYDEPSWVAEEDMHAPSLLDEYERRVRAQGRMAAMAAEETDEKEGK